MKTREKYFIQIIETSENLIKWNIPVSLIKNVIKSKY